MHSILSIKDSISPVPLSFRSERDTLVNVFTPYPRWEN